MRPNLSVSGTHTCNYPLVIWLEEKLKPLSTNKYCMDNIFGFTDEIRDMSIEFDHILLSYDVSSIHKRSFQGNHSHTCRQIFQRRRVQCDA